MRILSVVTLVSPYGEYGGPLRVAVNQCRALRERGHEVTLAGSYRGYDVPPTDVEGVPARLFPSYFAVPRSGHAGLASPGLWRWLHTHAADYDVAHIHLARDLVTLPAARIARRRGLRYVVQTHGMIDRSDRLLAKPLDAAFTLPVLAGAHRVLYLSDDERRDVLDVAGGIPLQLAEVPNGVPVVDAPAGGSGVDDGAEVLFLGRLTARKRPLAFVRMAEALGPEFPDVAFSLVGPDDGEGPAVAHAVRAAARRGSKIDWEGPIPPAEAVARMARASVYVLPAINEPYPMAVLEAMASGIPVVITESCGLAQIVQTAEAGLIVGQDDDSLTAAVRQLLSDPAGAQRLGSNGRSVVRTERSMGAIAEKLEGAYGD